jgi:hypothetical protein
VGMCRLERKSTITDFRISGTHEIGEQRLDSPTRKVASYEKHEEEFKHC